MTFSYKTRVGADGKLETYCDNADDAQAKADKLARDKRELRDMLAGNTQFHDDPNAAPLPAPEVRELPAIEWPTLQPGCVLTDHQVGNEQPPGDGWLLCGHIYGKRVWGRYAHVLHVGDEVSEFPHA